MFSFMRGFGYAFNGIRIAVKQERNLRFDICLAVYVYLFSLFYQFSKVEYAILTILIAGVMALEIVNSALERVVDKPKPERYAMAGVVKDMAAGAVLIFSIGAAICGLLLFWNLAVFQSIFLYFSNRLWLVAVFIASLGLSYWFIFRYARQSCRKEKE